MSDLARLAQCSVNTVSLALRDSPRISAATRKRIHKLASESGYRTNPLVSALISSRRTSKTAQTIAVLTKFELPFSEMPVTPMFCVELFAGMQEKAAEMGFHLEEFTTALPKSPDAGRLTGILRARGIHGVILFPSGSLVTPFPELDWRHFVVVTAGFHAPQWPLHRTYLDQRRSVEICLEQLKARGYRRIGLGLTHFMDPRWGYAGSGRFLAWQVQQPAEDRVPLIDGNVTEFPAVEAFMNWVRLHRPDAVLVYDDCYIELLERLKKTEGIDVLPVVINSTARTDMSGITRRVERLGQISIAVLARELYLNHYGIPESPQVTLVSGEWRDGAGLRPLVGKKAAARPSA